VVRSMRGGEQHGEEVKGSSRIRAESAVKHMVNTWHPLPCEWHHSGTTRTTSNCPLAPSNNFEYMRHTVQLLHRDSVTQKGPPTPYSCLDGSLPVGLWQGQQASSPILGPLIDYLCCITTKANIFVAWEQRRQCLQQLLP
jgi:hypothetical protein